MNSFAVLGLPPSSSEAEVKKAYRKLALRYHPDKAGTESTAKFQGIQDAYETIISHGLCSRTSSLFSRSQPQPQPQPQSHTQSQPQTESRDRGRDSGTGSGPDRKESHHRTTHDHDEEIKGRQSRSKFRPFDPFFSTSGFAARFWREHQEEWTRSSYSYSYSYSYFSRDGFNQRRETRQPPRSQPQRSGFDEEPKSQSRSQSIPKPKYKARSKSKDREIFKAIGQRLLEALNREKQRGRDRKSKDTDLKIWVEKEVDIKRGVDLLLDRKRPEMDFETLAAEVGKTMWSLRMLRFHYDSKTIGPWFFFDGMADDLALTVLLADEELMDLASAEYGKWNHDMPLDYDHDEVWSDLWNQ